MKQFIVKVAWQKRTVKRKPASSLQYMFIRSIQRRLNETYIFQWSLFHVRGRNYLSQLHYPPLGPLPQVVRKSRGGSALHLSSKLNIKASAWQLTCPSRIISRDSSRRNENRNLLTIGKSIIYLICYNCCRSTVCYYVFVCNHFII